MPGWRLSADRFACTLVSGVRSSWPASAVKRRVAASARSRSAAERPSRASISLNDAASERSSAGPSSPGTRRSRSSVPAIRDVTRRSRRSGRSSRSAANQTPIAAMSSAAAPKPSRRRFSADSLRSSRAQAPRHLQPRQPAQRLQPDRVGAVALAAGHERVQPVARRRAPGRRRAAEGRQLAPVEQQAQRRPRRRQHVVDALILRRQLALHRRQRRLAGELDGALELVVEGAALGAIDVARHDDPGAREHHGEDERDAQRQASAKAAHADQRSQTCRMKPIPRTVCSTRGSPSASSLRRR